MSGRRSVLAVLAGLVVGAVVGLLRRRPGPAALPEDAPGPDAARPHGGPYEQSGASTST